MGHALEFDRRVEYLAEETDQVEVYATEYYRDNEMIRRDVRVVVKKGFDVDGEVKNG